MIAKRIATGKGKSHNIIKLGNYVRDAGHDGEKCLMSWFAGCNALDYDLALAEMAATQAMNTRCRSNKTYHLVVSFRPEDEAKLTTEAFSRIEEAFAGELGLSGHQRVCGVHRNTNNLHLHIAYNLIHPEKFTTATSLHYDYQKLAQTCRAMEQEFGLEADKGIEAGKALEPKISQHAAALEAHTGEQSFQSYVLSLKNEIMRRMGTVGNWQDAHQALANYGIAIKPKANGFVLMPLNDKGGSLKASSLDKSMSRMRMEQRFGTFVTSETRQPSQSESELPHACERAFRDVVLARRAAITADLEKARNWQDVHDTAGKRTYQKSPRQPRNPERDRLYLDYQAALAEKIARIDAEKARNEASREWLKGRWQRMKEQLYAEVLTRRTRAIRMRMMLNLNRQDVLQERAAHKAAMAGIRADYPWYNWNGYLQHQATQGNTVALGVLRSMEERKAAQAAIRNPAREKTFLEVQFDDRQAAKAVGAKWDPQAKHWYAPRGSDLDRFTVWLPAQPDAAPTKSENGNFERAEPTAPDTPKEKKTPGERLAYLAWQERERIKAGSANKSFFSGCSYRIDNRGVAIITLVSGGTIRDAGKKLHFSPDEDSRQAARLYAMAKFGKFVKEKGSTIEQRERTARLARLFEPHIGILKECARYGLRSLSQLAVVCGRRKSEVLLQGYAHDDLER